MKAQHIKAESITSNASSKNRQQLILNKFNGKNENVMQVRKGFNSARSDGLHSQMNIANMK
jgi:hypothetical protein